MEQNKTILWVLALLVVIGVGGFFYNKSKKESAAEAAAKNTALPPNPTEAKPKEFADVPPEIRVALLKADWQTKMKQYMVLGFDGVSDPITAINRKMDDIRADAEWFANITSLANEQGIPVEVKLAIDSISPLLAQGIIKLKK
jgi:cbb3-type cytochrome oxidase subunit 3